MKLVAHASPRVLEAELLDLVASAKSHDPLAPVLIVVPSRRLADHVTRRLVERFGAVLSVSVLHHRALAERVMEQAGAPARFVLNDDLLDTLFARVVSRAPTGPLRDFARDHPGAASALRRSLTDLREAGIDPANVSALLSGPEAETAALYTRWSAALDALLERGAVDEPGLAQGAAEHAAAFAARFDTIAHHGAYDLIGVHVELVRALDRGRELTFLLPADPDDPSGSFGVSRARAIATPSTPCLRPKGPTAPASIAFLHAQGARAELQTAAYEALAAVESGTPPHEVAVVVRSFGPYAAAMDALLDANEGLWHTSHTRPLRSDTEVAAGLRSIAADGDHGPRRFGGHAADFETLTHDADANERLAPLFESLRAVETILGDERTVSRAEAFAWLEARVDATSLQPADRAGGVRILDAMQARGLTFSHVGLAGMNQGIFPRVGREDPFLSDASRLRLRESTGRPLPIAAESHGEERGLLAMLLGSAAERVCVSWRRADDEARPLVPSLALRDIARFAKLENDTTDVLARTRALPAHPRSRLEAWAQSPGLLGRGDETLLAALASETGADARPAVAARRPELAAGIALVEATETFAPTTGAYDGRIGPSARRNELSATALERLGRCPLQFFFRHVLHVEAKRTPPTSFESDMASIGLKVHEVLRDVYARLRDEAAFDGGTVSARVARAREILRDAWSAHAGLDQEERATRLPVLSRIEDNVWLKTLDAFLDADLRRIEAEGLVPEALEQDLKTAIPGGPPELVVRARFDRVLRGQEGSVVSDYKTGGKLKDRVSPSEMLSGSKLQVAIYALISGLPVELLGVGPAHDPDEDVVRFDGFKSDGHRGGVLETLRVLASLAEAGRFPIRPGDACGWCDYRSACRHGHPPTTYREDRADDVRDALDCWRKSAKLPTLAAVRRETVS